MKTPTITEEKTAVESRIAEIENEMSEAHRDHAFEYWLKTDLEKYNCCSDAVRAAFNRAHSIYCRSPRIITVTPPISAMYALYALGVVSGMIISLITFFITIN